MSLYSREKLMAETRRLAAEYHLATGQTLPVTAELARYDAMRLLDLQIPSIPDSGVDFIEKNQALAQKIQVKGRVIFDDGKSGHRIGQINQDGAWDQMLLVLMNAQYEPYEIHRCDREAILEAVSQSKDTNRSKRGALSVSKFKIIGELVWTKENGVEL